MENNPRAERVKKLMRKRSQEATDKFFCLISYVTFVIIGILIIGAILVIDTPQQSTELGYNPNNPCGIDPITGERIFQDCSFSPEFNK